MEFEGKVVFVTAAAGAGIGQAVARTFASEGATVVIRPSLAKVFRAPLTQASTPSTSSAG